MTPLLTSIAQRIGLCSAFTAQVRAAAAVEFAALLPFMLLLYIGGVEVSQAVATDRKVTLTSRTVADLASQAITIDNADMSNILAASGAVIAPYNPSNLIVTVSRVDVSNNLQASVVWSDSLNGTPHSVGQSVTLPAALQVANASYIWGEAQYAYTPTLGYVLTNTITLSEAIFMAPRMSQYVTRTP